VLPDFFTATFKLRKKSNTIDTTVKEEFLLIEKIGFFSVALQKTNPVYLCNIRLQVFKIFT